MAVSLVLPSVSSIILRLLAIDGGAFVLLILLTGLLRVIGSSLLRPAMHGSIGPARRLVRID